LIDNQSIQTFGAILSNTSCRLFHLIEEAVAAKAIALDCIPLNLSALA
jgi:hypothetical protein